MTTRLMQLFEFTQEDLAYNRQGRLSPRQTARLTSKRRGFKLILLVLGLTLACGGGGALAVLGILSVSQSTVTGLGMLVGAGIFALLGAPFIFLGIKPMSPVKIAVAQGPIRLARVQRTRRVNNSTSTYVATELHLADKIFTVPDESFSALEEGAAYAVYYWDGLTDIFSLEKL
ncbi:MAG: hypothetical protein DDG60_05310 [Anaerolineae bacterium]|nr:MAG: hypothetical protein DDG60_05310 [Anaerolineae bacterium]